MRVSGTGVPALLLLTCCWPCSWQGALGERPYHISALFVVDLARFRSQAATDRSYRV